MPFDKPSARLKTDEMSISFLSEDYKRNIDYLRSLLDDENLTDEVKTVINETIALIVKQCFSKTPAIITVPSNVDPYNVAGFHRMRKALNKIKNIIDTY